MKSQDQFYAAISSTKPRQILEKIPSKSITNNLFHMMKKHDIPLIGPFRDQSELDKAFSAILKAEY